MLGLHVAHYSSDYVIIYNSVYCNTLRWLTWLTLGPDQNHSFIAVTLYFRGSPTSYFLCKIMEIRGNNRNIHKYAALLKHQNQCYCM